MSCKHPLKGFPIGLTENGKTDYKITSYSADYVAYKKTNSGTKHIDVGKGKPYWLAPDWNYVFNFIEIPCGHCIECRLQKAREWANRMMLECQEHETNYFLTLTYNDKFLPDTNYLGVVNEHTVDLDTGELEKSPIHPLKLDDMQKFLKRLRKQQKKDFNNEIRYYACGEYGSQSFRPHYHLIIFGLKLDDLIKKSVNELGQPLYYSPTIDKLWTDSELYNNGNGVPPFLDKDRKEPGSCYGYHAIGEVTWESCCYTARYVTKKQYGDNASIYEELNIPPEFATMSRRPGLARKFYDENKEKIFDTDELFINLGMKGGKKVRPPRYYDQLFDIDYPEEHAIIKKNRRKIAEDLAKVKDSMTSLSYLQQLEVEETYLKERTKVLRRKDL